MDDMRGRTVAITGATSGIGEVAAITLAKAGASVVFVARNPAKGAAMLERLRQTSADATPALVVGDLSTIAGMKAVATEIAARAPRIDVLINNAGAFFEQRQVTVDGLEMTFALNHMAYFVVAQILRSSLAPDARIVSTASTGHTIARLDFDDLQSARRYNSLLAYGLSKLCNILWTRELARRLAGTGVTANCLHPGGVNTGFAGDAKGPLGAVFHLIKPFMLTPQKGADTLVWLASSPDVAGKTGGYWTKRTLTQPSATARDDAAAARLWAESLKLSGLSA